MPVIGLAGCRDNTADIYRFLTESKFDISHVLTISPQDAESKYDVSGYVDMREVVDPEKTQVYHVEDYRLRTSKADKIHLKKMGIDLLIVLGWQRIIPKWYLSALSIGAIGMHGASKPLPFGRGHSALNWSIVEGREEFHDSLFFYTPRADDGEIIGTHRFDITEQDTCKTLHYKHRLAMMRLLKRELPGVLNGTTVTTSQPHEGATYYPKRTPEHGRVDWSQQAVNVARSVRAVTKPYPGAFSYIDGKKMMIWGGQLFDTKITWNAKPGTIVEVFQDGCFIVQARDYGFLVTDYEWDGGLPAKKSIFGDECET